MPGLSNTLRIRPILAVVCLAAVGALLPARAQVPCPGHAFAATAAVDGKTLLLNGVGMRAVAWLQGYVAGLYLERPPGPVVSDPGKVIEMTVAKRIEIRMLENAPSKEFTKALQRGVKRHHKDSVSEDLAKKVEQFGEAVDRIGELKKGTVVYLDFNPAKGTTLRLRDAQPAVTIEGKPFHDEVLWIFLGEKPTDPELKTGLLGGKGC